MTAHSLHRVLLLLTLILTLCIGGQVHAAESPTVQSVSLSERGNDLVLSADVALSLNSQLESAAERGLPLYFTVEVEITRPRWYWFNESVLTATQTWRIVHNPLTHQWRVSSGNLALPVSSLSEGLSVVRHVRNWRIADRTSIKAGSNLEGRMRVRFDVSQLSKAFQVNALNSSDWSLATPWTEFAVQVNRDQSSVQPQPMQQMPPPAPPVLAPPAAVPQPPSLSNGTGQGLGLTMPDAPHNGGNGNGLSPGAGPTEAP